MWIAKGKNTIEKIYGPKEKAIEIAAAMALNELSENQTDEKIQISISGPFLTRIERPTRHLDSIDNQVIIELSLKIESIPMDKAQYLAEFYRSTCFKCNENAVKCPKDSKIQKCLRGDHIVGTFSAIIYCVNNDFKRDDPRHYDFEAKISLEELSELFLCVC